MLNYISAEIYKALHRKYVYLFTGAIVALEVLLMGAMTLSKSWGNGATVSVMLMTAIPMLVTGLYLSLVVGDMVFSEQYKYGTLKNEVSFGIPRSRIYLGKLIVEAIVGVAMMAVVLGVYILLCFLLLPMDGEELGTLGLMGRAVAMALPLYMGALGIAHLLYFSLKSSTAAAFIPAGFLSAGGPLFGTLADYASGLFQTIGECVYPLLLTTPFNMLSKNITAPLVLQGWVLGIAWLVITTVVGLVVIRKKEIN